MTTVDWAARLRALYADLETELKGVGVDCAGCGECCRFDRVDHILYASGLERRYFARHAPPAVVPDASDELLEQGLRCPFQADGGCAAREGRVLGCRLHFCRWPESAEDEGAFLERWHDALKALHDELGEEWDYRPLFPWKR